MQRLWLRVLPSCICFRSFSRPYGTQVIPAVYPALKRRAIIGSPFGTKPSAVFPG